MSYTLQIGLAEGVSEYLDMQFPPGTTSYTASGLPTDGGALYVTLTTAYAVRRQRGDDLGVQGREQRVATRWRSAESSAAATRHLR
jgi:hypothetical protein